MARNVWLHILRGPLASMPALVPGELYFATDTLALYVGPTPTKIGGVENSVQAVVDFGASPTTSEDTTARATVNAPWVTAKSILFCTIVEGGDHTDDEIAAEQVTVTVGNVQPGIGFDVVLSAPKGASGTFLVNVED